MGGPPHAKADTWLQNRIYATRVDILRMGTCVAGCGFDVRGFFFVAHRKIVGGPRRHIALPIKHLSPNILQVLLHIGKTTNRWKWSDVIAILSIVLEASESGPCVAENVIASPGVNIVNFISANVYY